MKGLGTLRRLPWKAHRAARLRRLTYAFQITLERRLLLFLLADVVFVVGALVEALVAGARLSKVYSDSVFLPSVLLCIPALSGMVALERRAGSLDLALASPVIETYFLRRALPVTSVFALQGIFLLSCCYLEMSGGLMKALSWNSYTGGWLRSLTQCLLLHAFLTAVLLFFATRLRTSGGVWAASLGTTLLFSGWLKANPAPRSLTFEDFWMGWPKPMLIWTWSMLVVIGATAMFYLYARDRLRRPESMLD